jgi:glycosyltransferase involved in cell wall biosynthesis
MPLVSVVIPTWERGRWLKRALDSVFAQTEHDFEVLVVDDGSSTDAAERVVKARTDERVRYLRLPQHRGVSAARNAGVVAATGKYVAFLDDDDEWLPQKLESQVRVLEASDATIGAVYTARLSVDQETGRVATIRFPKSFQPQAGNIITTSSLLVKRQCFENVGLFDENFKASGDYDMWIRISERFGFVYIDVPLIKYSIHADRLSSDYQKKRQAVELLLKKHWAVFAADRGCLARQYVNLAVMCYHDGKVNSAARAFCRAVILCPLRMATYTTAFRALIKSRTVTW